MTKQYFNLPIKFEAIPFVRSESGVRFLLVKRIPEDGGFWQPITGTLQSDESLVDCLYREIQEEINIGQPDIISVTDMFHSFTWMKGDITITEFVYGVELKDEYKIQLGSEHDAYQWCGFDEALSLLEKENNKKALFEFRSYLLAR
jgi:lipoyl(octanoyl) transferase